MREIKFRAWCNKTMLSNVIPFAKTVEIIVIQPMLSGECRLKKVEAIMQYTGLKDKSGTEIYEGDILKNDYDKIGVVEYREIHRHSYSDVIGFCAGNIDLSERGFGFCEVEVIGNIYGDPELIKD